MSHVPGFPATVRWIGWFQPNLGWICRRLWRPLRRALARYMDWWDQKEIYAQFQLLNKEYKIRREFTRHSFFRTENQHFGHHEISLKRWYFFSCYLFYVDILRLGQLRQLWSRLCVYSHGPFFLSTCLLEPARHNINVLQWKREEQFNLCLFSIEFMLILVC